MLLSAKLIFLAAALNFVIFHRFIFNGNSEGELYALVVIVVSISSLIVISAFILAFYRENRSINTDSL
jgi:NADH:ubiquinone oxidoreductase subunit K